MVNGHKKLTEGGGGGGKKGREKETSQATNCRDGNKEIAVNVKFTWLSHLEVLYCPLRSVFLPL